MAYQGRVLFWTGVITLICAFLGNSIIRLFGWFWSAALTPVIVLISGSIFFSSILLQDTLLYLLDLDYTSSLVIIAFTGGVWHVLSKGIKYSLFDSTKEMTYIPLESETKTKGKAATDIIGAKIGKSTGAIIQFICFSIFPNAVHADIAEFLAMFFFITCIIWIYGVSILDKHYKGLVQKA